MKMYLAFLAMVGIFAFSILYLADRERKAGAERLSNYKIEPHAAIEADPDLRQQSKRSPYMRNERYRSVFERRSGFPLVEGESRAYRCLEMISAKARQAECWSLNVPRASPG